MSFFSTPPGYKPADSLTIGLASAAGVFVVYSSKIGPCADVSATQPGDPSINSSIRKAGWESLLLIAAMTVLSRDLNVTILGGSAIILEHVMYLHSEMCSPADGQIQASPEAYQPAGMSAGANLSMVAG